MHLLVHVKDKAIAVSVGDGLQPVRWLANVSTSRYDGSQGRCLGEAVGMKTEDGQLLSLGQTLTDAGLTDMQHVWVVFKASKSTSAAQKPRQSSRAVSDDEDD